MRYVIEVKNRDGSPSVKFVKVSDEPLSLEFMKSRVGQSDGKSYIEIAYNQFPESPRVVVVVDECGKLKQLPPGMVTMDDVLAGDVLIAWEGLSDDGECNFYGILPDDIGKILHLVSASVYALMKTEEKIEVLRNESK